MQIKDYVKPELLVVALVLYFIGMWLKQSETVKDKYIPVSYTHLDVYKRQVQDTIRNTWRD